MRTREGKIVALYNVGVDKSWDYKFIIFDIKNYKTLAYPMELPNDFEKNHNGSHVLVEVDDNDTPILENGRVKLHKKTMNLREYLSFFGPSKEIKQRMNNGQIKVNNRVIKDFDVEVSFDYDTENFDAVELGEFLMDCNISLKQVNELKVAGLDIKDFFGTSTIHDEPTNIPKYTFLQKYVLISLSKREHYVVLNDEFPSRLPHKIYTK